MMDSFTDRTILVTGGCGSIGSVLVERLLEFDPASIRVFDNNERGLFDLQQRLGSPEGPLRFLLGDIRERDRVEMAMRNVDVVFHAGALKHVELNEYNPFEAIQTNVVGTQNVIQAAMEENVDSVVGISTDKASNPTSVMGATKLLAERLIIAANTYRGKRDICFSCVRFGNVLGSSGSVVPLFLDQIRDGGPITVTDPDMTRFIMPVERAVEFVIQAHDKMTRGEVFVLKMPAFRVGDLAEALRVEFAPEFNMDPASIGIDVIGKRPGERKHEKLLSLDEIESAAEFEKMFVLLPQIKLEYDEYAETEDTSISGEYTSADTELLEKDELANMVREAGIKPGRGI
jgi:FlaA1/EpsC-like NDP-sugar epimerase